MHLDPIGDQMFAHDYQKWVLQQPNVRIVNYELVPHKPFIIKPAKKSKKTKEDVKKEKDKKEEKSTES